MWDWLLGRSKPQDEARRRFEYERDQRRLSELKTGLRQREKRERDLIAELRDLEAKLARAHR